MPSIYGKAPRKILYRTNRNGKCIDWLGGNCGMGRYKYGKYKKTTVSRYVYEWAMRNAGEEGGIPPEMHVDHLCGNGLCINIAHLQLVHRSKNSGFTGKKVDARAMELLGIERVRPIYYGPTEKLDKWLPWG